MNLLLEAASHDIANPWNITVGVVVALILFGLMGVVHGVGATRPHS